MSSESSILKILKDKTRRKIIFLLEEKGSLSYTDILASLADVSTGLLNYHLKVLDDLVAKNEGGQYILTEKGKFSLRLLSELPEASGFGKWRKWEGKFWKAVLIIAVGSIIINLGAYFLGYIELSELYSLLWIVPAVSMIYLFEHIMRDLTSKKFRSKYLLANYYARGIVIGMLLWFALIFGMALGISSGIISLTFLGYGGQKALEIGSLIVCCAIGSLINKRQCGSSPTE